MAEQLEFDPETLDEIVRRMTRIGRQVSISELQARANYVAHVRINPTKSMEEAVIHLYEAIKDLGGYVSEGIEDADLARIKSIHSELVKRGVLKPTSQQYLEMMLAKINFRRMKKEIGQDDRVCFVLSPDNRDMLVIDVPKKPKNREVQITI